MNTEAGGWNELEQDRVAGLQGIALLAAAIIMNPDRAAMCAKA